MTSPQTQAILLLTSHFSKSPDSKAKPLSIKEWGRFALWLRDNQLAPEALLKGDLAEKLHGWSDSKITTERIQSLINRGSALALAMEKWSRTGLWVMTRSDTDYPGKLKQILKNDAPPVLFGSGNRQLLNKGGIAVVGSRNTSEADLKYSKRLGELAAGTGYSVVSGGARGVDEAAMLGSLDAEGAAVGILANDLLRASNSAKYRRHLRDNNLVLVSPFHPEAGFNVGNAMQRNKYIYCLANAAIAVHSGTRGGTWEGVLENIRNDWVSIWVKPTEDSGAGNAALVKKGAQWLPTDFQKIDFDELIRFSPAKSNSENSDMFEPRPQVVVEPGEILDQVKEPAAPKQRSESAYKAEDDDSQPARIAIQNDSADNNSSSEASPGLKADMADISLYQHFLLVLQKHASGSPKTVEELMEISQLQKGQLTTWLKQGVEEKKLSKLTRPVRYQWSSIAQNEMFE